MLIVLTLQAALAQGCEPRDIAADAEVAVTAVTDDELELAIRTAELAIASLDCAADIPKPEDLASLWQALGTALLYSGDMKKAEAALRQSAAVAPGLYNDRLGPRARVAWEAVDLGEPAELRVEPMPATARLVVDGEIRERQPVSLGQGSHLVQVLDSEALVLNRVLPLEPGQRAEIPTGLTAPPRRGAQNALWIGVTSGVLAGGVYAGAMLLDNSLQEAVDRGDSAALASRRQRSLILGYGVAPTLAVGAITGVTLHFVLK